jgi:hypothetical protein
VEDGAVAHEAVVATAGAGSASWIELSAAVSRRSGSSMYIWPSPVLISSGKIVL